MKLATLRQLRGLLPRALDIYSFGIPIGGAAGLLFDGLIASRVNWRVAFLVVGGLGLILALLFRYAMREPLRGGLDVQAQAPADAACARRVQLQPGSGAGGRVCGAIVWMLFMMPARTGRHGVDEPADFASRAVTAGWHL